MEIINNADLKKYNTYDIGGIAQYLVKPNSVEELISVVKNKKYYVLGNGSNVILPDEDYDGYVVLLSNFKNISIKNNIVEVEAGVLLPYLNKLLIDKGYTNFIWASSIPGTIGGSIVSNAGAYNHDIFEYLIDITYLKNGEIKVLKKCEIDYSYRHTNLKNKIILKARFNLLKDDLQKSLLIMEEQIKKRKETQPLEYKNAGSVFRNPEGLSAGKLIDDAHLKGKIIGGAMISEKHANFIINYNNASSKDIQNLIELIKKEIKKKYNIDLVLEQKIITW